MDGLRISTNSLPPRDRIEVFREVFGRKILRIEIEPLSTSLFQAEMTLQSLPGLGIAGGTLSAMHNVLPNNLIDNDDLVLVILQDGVATARQFGREETIRGGQAMVTANDEPASFVGHTPTRLINLRFERGRLAAQLADPEAVALRPMPQSDPALRLLSTYASSLAADLPLMSPNLRRLAADHIYDLAAVALGATRDAVETARLGGLRAARLDIVLRLIRAGYDDPAISPASVAAKAGISPRYLHKLLDETGSSFSERVRDLRLARALALLGGEGGRRRKINDAAYAAGFSDLSHFNRLFRLRYGLTPTAARAHRQGEV